MEIHELSIEEGMFFYLAVYAAVFSDMGKFSFADASNQGDLIPGEEL
jgi:hypothetical protein